MLKPSDINPNVVTNNPTLTTHITYVTQQFEDALLAARASGRWPATVSQPRDGVLLRAVEHVANAYRGEGWIVDTSIEGIRASIDHPDRNK